jgi:hypothetical protein
MKLALLIVVLASVACGKEKTRDERAADEFRAFADRMCACDSTECKRQVKDDFQAWEAGEMGKLFGKARGAWIDEVEAKIKRGCR